MWGLGVQALREAMAYAQLRMAKELKNSFSIPSTEGLTSTVSWTFFVVVVTKGIPGETGVLELYCL